MRELGRSATYACVYESTYLLTYIVESIQEWNFRLRIQISTFEESDYDICTKRGNFLSFVFNCVQFCP